MRIASSDCAKKVKNKESYITDKEYNTKLRFYDAALFNESYQIIQIRRRAYNIVTIPKESTNRSFSITQKQDH